MSEDYEEREVTTKATVGFTFGIPEVIPGLAARVEGKFERDWARRARHFFDAAKDRGGVTDGELGQRLEDDSRARDIFRVALNRAMDTGDPDYVDVMGRLAGAACDDAALDETTFILGELARLEPIHVRVLFQYGFDLYRRDENGRTTWDQPVEFSNADGAMPIQISSGGLIRDLGVNPWVTQAIVERLESAGFIEPQEKTLPPVRDDYGRTIRQQQHTVSYKPTGLARIALGLVFENIGRNSQM